MTRQPHDQLAKEYLEELLTPLGLVETSRDGASEVTEIEIRSCLLKLYTIHGVLLRKALNQN